MKTTMAMFVVMLGIGACGGEPLPSDAACGTNLPSCEHYYCCAGTECPASQAHPAGFCRSVQDNFSE